MSGSAILDLWEQASDLSPQRRALVLAEAMPSGDDALALGDKPVGVRDAHLLALHVEVGGQVMEATATCPHCGEEVEFSLDAPTLSKAAAQIEARGATPLAQGDVLTWRVPSARDLIDLEAYDDPALAAAELFTRCAGDTSRLSDADRDAVVAAIADADPLAEVLTDLTCPECDRSFTADVDVAEFAWDAVREAARRLLSDIDTLAGAYGWREPDVLALPDGRRAAYLALVSERS